MTILRFFTGLLVGIICMQACSKDEVATSGKDPYRDTVTPAILISKGGVSPDRGHVNDEIIIRGQGFKAHQHELSILFNGQPGTLLEVSDSTVKVKVPPYASTGNINAQVGQQYFFGPFFRVMGPMEMDTVYPSSRGADNTIQDIIPVEGGKYLIVGDFTNYDNANIDGGVNRVARINSDGTIDRSFRYGKNTGSPATVIRAAMLPDGKYLVAGSFASYEGLPYVSSIARLYNTGGLETENITRPSGKVQPVSVLKGGVSGVVTGLHVQPDGKMIVIGYFRYYVKPNYNLVTVNGADSLHLDSTMVNFMARLYPDGTLDTSYNYDLQNHRGKEGVNGSINKSIYLPDGKVLIVGTFTKYNGQPAQRIARINTDGSLDPTFKSSAGANFPIYDVAQQPDGKLIVAGLFTTYAGVTVPYIARLLPDGALDPSLQVGKGVDGAVYNISIMPQGEILLSGSFTKFNDVTRNNVVVLNPDGSVHPAYNTNGGINLGTNDVNGAFAKVLQLPDEHAMLAVGSFTKFDFRQCNRILRIKYQ
ncbi:MAG TPA: IPT/TIG domain-containing protein [Chitinophaga sp.]|uniref:IPT/TIG domain-containing protein n=1 Tax=Chitinophaga sp. TaxID=1869181 RepID=UPI002DBE7C37|nr:IPT/TIG domain-containing protein [Chitinophaga sp.]HEU4554757.1 IPT/TIG domain-containing protein [Chitinophaga sp.]